jgi:hypothetical protein
MEEELKFQFPPEDGKLSATTASPNTAQLEWTCDDCDTEGNTQSVCSTCGAESPQPVSSVSDVPGETAAADSVERFQFMAFAPKAFQALRRTWSVSEGDFLHSLTGHESTDVDLFNPYSKGAGRSGNYFFWTPDRKYMVKTLKADEMTVIEEVRSDYYAYHTQ